MFININGIAYNRNSIKSIHNQWVKKNGKIQKEDAIIEFMDGDKIASAIHIDIESENLNSATIAAESGWTVITYWIDKDKKPYFYHDPVIAWKIDDYGIFPIAPNHFYKTSDINWVVRLTGSDKLYGVEVEYENFSAFEKDITKESK